MSDSARSIADLLGPWVESSFDSGLIRRCQRHWNVPVDQLPNEALATFLRQRIALELVITEAERRVQANANDGSELHEGELAKALGLAKDSDG